MLFYIIQEFNTKKAYMGDDKITSVDMGYIFEELIKDFQKATMKKLERTLQVEILYTL